MDVTYDEKIDYYKTLGLDKTATTEEIKTAYVTLVKTTHPDIVGTSPLAKKHFQEIQDAFSVLSNAGVKLQYDNARSHPIISSAGAGGMNINNGIGNPATIYTIQKDNYNTRVKREASSNWRDLQIKNKYRTEKWQNLSLDKKKAIRKRPVNSFGGSVLLAIGSAVGVIALCKVCDAKLKTAAMNSR